MILYLLSTARFLGNINVINTQSMNAISSPNLTDIPRNTSKSHSFVIGDTSNDIFQKAKYLHIDINCGVLQCSCLEIDICIPYNTQYHII